MLPNYIRRGGDIVSAQPTIQTDAKVSAFVVPSDAHALTQLLEAHLNSVLKSSGGGTSYSAILPAAFIVYCDITTLVSQTPPYSTRGSIQERDFSIWIPALEISPAGRRLVFYLPYVFVDNVSAMVTGREIWGFFKQTALLGEGGLLPLSVDALAIREFAPSSTAAVMRLLTAVESLDKTPSATSVLGNIEAQTPGDIWMGIWDWIQHHALQQEDFAALLADIQTNGVPLVFLKQFRDIADPGKACYQAITTARAKPITNPTVNAMPHYHFDIPTIQSHPIVRECGFSGETFEDTFGLRFVLNFIMESGSVVGETT